MDASDSPTSQPEKKPQLNAAGAIIPSSTTSSPSSASPSPTKLPLTAPNSNATTVSPKTPTTTSSSTNISPQTPNSLNNAATTVSATTNQTTSSAIHNNNSSNITLNSGALTVDQIDIDILPVVYEIIRSIEKDPTDIAAKQRESQECSQKVLELHKRLEAARTQIRQLPGINYNQEEQLQRLETLRNQLVLKQKLIQKYKNTQF